MAINTEKFLEDARKLTTQRMEAAEHLAEKIAARVQAEEALKAAQAEEKKAYTQAEKNGWTKTELNKLKPVKRQRNAQKKTTASEHENKNLHGPASDANGPCLANEERIKSAPEDTETIDGTTLAETQDGPENLFSKSTTV